MTTLGNKVSSRAASMKPKPKLGPSKPSNTTATGRKPNNYDVFIAQRKKAGTRGY
jgi:hypothetical protein